MKLSFLSALLWTATAVASQTALATSSPLQLSLPEATRIALRDSPTYQLAVTEVERVKGARQAVTPPFPDNPIVSFAVGPRDQGEGAQTSYAAEILQRVDLFGQRGKRIEAADEQVSLAEARLRALAAELRARARTSYITALISDRRVAFAEQQVSFAERVFAAAEQRSAYGAASDIEKRTAETELGLSRAASAQAQASRLVALHELRVVLGLPHDRPLTLTTPLAAPPVRPLDQRELEAAAREQRRDLQVLRQEGKAIDAEIDKLRRERLPAVWLEINVEQDSIPRGEYWVGPGVAVSAPVWQRNQGALAMAAAERQRQRIALESTEVAALRDVNLAVALVGQRRQEVVALEQAIRTAEQLRELVLEGWQAGKFDIFRLTLADVELVTARVGYLTALAALWTGEIDVDRAIGVIEEGL